MSGLGVGGGGVSGRLWLGAGQCITHMKVLTKIEAQGCTSYTCTHMHWRRQLTEMHVSL